jgi:hypothetical protein
MRLYRRAQKQRVRARCIRANATIADRRQVHRHADFLRQLSDAVNFAVEGCGTVVHLDLVEQAILGEALDVLVAIHGVERATVGRRLDEAAARARILPISAARAIQLGQPELQMQ